jgi:TolB-like protein/Tfp pilus assembly protein PilF
MPNKLSQFWQELSRRNVIRVITVYAASAFVVLELVDIITEPFGLPGWTLKLVVVILAVGLVLAVILSWIYDLQPEGGFVKTEPAKELENGDIPKTSNGWKIASYFSFVVIVGLVILNVIPRSKDATITKMLDKSIAVLPFENLSEESGNEFFVDGLVEDLLNRISVIEELKVISRTTSEKYREKGDKTVPQIADELNVAYILEGSVQRYGQKARVNVQLIDARNDDHIWADRYDRNIEDVFETQSEIAMKIASELDAILTSEQKALVHKENTRNIRAFELYQMGRFYWNKRTGEGYAKSIDYFTQAIEADPGYGLAYAGLSDTYILMGIQGYMDRMEGRNKSEELAFKALELDGNLGEAYTVLGQIYDYVDWEWDKAENAFRQALPLNPNYSTAHKYYAEHLSITGDHEAARIHMNRAVELDPLSFVVRYTSAQFYYHQGYFEKALNELDVCDELEEDHPWMPRYRFFCYWQLGKENEAFKALGNWLQLNPGYNLETAEEIYSHSGLTAVMEWIVDTKSMMSDEEVANADKVVGYAAINKTTLLTMLGRYDEALTRLERGFQSHHISPWISFNIHYTNLQDNPRFQAILKGMGLGK